MTVPLPVVRMVDVNIGSAPFATHSFSQGQRLLKLLVTTALPGDDGLYKIWVYGTAGWEGGAAWLLYGFCC